MKKSPLIFTLLSAAMLAPFQSARATDVFWSGGTDASWNTGANWGGTAPANDITSDIAVFSGTTAYTNQPTLDAFTTQSVNGLTLGGTSTVALTISSNTGTQSTSGTTSSGSSTITLADVTGVAVGQNVTGTRIPLGTFVTAVDTGTNTITLSQPTSGGTLNNASALTFTSSLKLGSAGITLAAGTPNVANIITAPLVLGADQAWNNNATSRSLQLQGSIYLDHYTLTLSGVTGSTISFNGSTGTQSISGSGNIIVDTAGTVSFGPGTGNRQQNTFTGGVTLNNGTITLQGGNSGGGGGMGGLGTGVFTINGGSLSGGGNIAGKTLTISGQVWNADWSFTGGKAVDMGTGGVTLGTATGTSRTLTATSSQPLTIGGGISDGTTANSFIKAGSGNVLLTGASTYTGTTTIQAGTIQIGGADDRLPTGTVLAVNGGATAGTFDLNGLNQTVTGLTTGSGTVQGVVTNTLAASTSTLTVSGTSTFDGIIQDGSSTALTALTKSNTGTLILTGANTYTGATTISGGTLALGAANRIAAASNLVLSGGTLATGGFNQTLGTLTLSANSTIDLGSGASALVFADSSGVTWSDSITLSFLNYTDGVDSIRFGTDANALTTAQLSQITLDGSTATLDANGYLTSAIPEPATYALLGGLFVLLIAVRQRRKPQAN